MSSNRPDHYQILGVLRDASPEEIKRAYLEAAQRLHPDKNVAPGETEIFLDIQQSYEVLSNPKRRKLYDATLPPESAANSTVRHEFVFSRANLVKLEEPQVIYGLLEIGSREGSDKIPAPPLNVCLVLDRSTSMQGEKMDMVKSAAIQLIRSLRPQDVFSVVAFSDKAEVIIPAAINWDTRKQEAHVQFMQTFGSTEIYHGLEAGLQEVRRSLNPSRVNHIILLTDGHTYGDELACFKLAEEAALQNIGITGLGIGTEWNDIFLDALAGRTGGSATYISDPKDIQRILVEKFKSLISSFADDVILEYKEQQHVRINYAFRLQPEASGIVAEGPMHLGQISRETPLQVLFEFIVDPQAYGQDQVILMDAMARISVAALPAPVPPIRLQVAREVSPTPSVEPPPAKILNALSKLTLYRMHERARLAAEGGEFSAAARHLQNLATHLLSRGESSLAKTALLEAENLERMHAWSSAGSKDIKYSTRALLLSAPKEKAG